jgi:predicted PurR-regulated permease PerM
MFIYAGYASLVFIVIMIVIGIITNFSKKRSEKQEALRDFVISIVGYVSFIGVLTCLFIFHNGVSSVSENITNLEEAQKVIENQKNNFENLLFLFVFTIFSFFVLVLPSIYNFAKIIISEGNSTNSKKETNILGLREI